MARLHQGDILKIENFKYPVVVVSKDFFNLRGSIIGCPIVKNSCQSSLHIWTSAKECEGYVQCENLSFLDISVRGHKRTGRLPFHELMNVSDAIQGIFEYV